MPAHLRLTLTDEQAAVLDERRGAATRTAYVTAHLAEWLEAGSGKTAPRAKPAPVAARVTPEPDAAREVPFSSAPARCAHPKARVIKGYCGACGTHVG